MHKLPACILVDGRAFQRPNITNKIYGSIAYGANIRLDCKITGRLYSVDWYRGEQRVREQRVSYDKLTVSTVASGKNRLARIELLLL